MDYNVILKWCFAHWQFLATCLLSVINIVILICKKKVSVKSVDTILSQVLLILPDLVAEAEKVLPDPGTGKDKLIWVLNKALKYICEISDLSAQAAASTYGTLILESIESILSTPVKK